MSKAGKRIRTAREGFVATVTIDRQEKLNALNTDVLGDLAAAIAIANRA